MTPTGEGPSPVPLHRPDLADGFVMQRARELDMLLRDTAQDLGFAVNLAGASFSPSDATERALVAQAASADHWVVSPRVELEGGHIVLRFVLVPAGAAHALVRTEITTPEDFQVRAVVMLRDLVRAGQNKQPLLITNPIGAVEDPSKHDRRSEGRAILAMHAAVFGGYVGYSLQRASGSDETRLTYPLMAIGTGVGLGSSLLIAEEWDVGLGDAWYISAGVVWPTLGGLLLARGRDVQPESDRHAWGIAGGLGGLTLALVSLSFAGMHTGGAAVAHSGGAIGTGLGAGAEMAIRGKTKTPPYRGLGYGALGGVVLGGIIGRSVEESPYRVMMIDVGVGLGALSFAAVASPLLIAEPTKGRERAWVLLTMSGAAAGGATAYWMTNRLPARRADTLPVRGQPLAGVIAHSTRLDGSVVPAYGVGWSGTF